ncbi:hypothetical protein Bca4012_020166 [Brassica carinata]
MSSIGSSAESRYRHTKQRGIRQDAIAARRWIVSLQKASKIRRLFHCCQMGSEKVSLYSYNHVFAPI